MSLFHKRIGIDLGTANILVYVPRRGVVLNEPSVVAVSQTDKKILAVGTEAKTMIGRTPDDIVAYRPMKNGVIADYRVAEAMLSFCIRKSMGRFNFIKPDVLISVPAGVTSTERRAVVEAAIRAGAKNAYVVKEPILGAIGGGIRIEEPGGHMIVDCGGGTTDVAVISLGGIVNSTSVKCAGDKIDRAIIDYVKREHNLAIGDKTAERIKTEIGAALPMSKEENKTIDISGRDYISGLPRTITLSTNQIVGAITKELKQITQAIKDVLAETPPELASDIIERGILMTGGTSQLLCLTTLVEKTTGVRAELVEQPLEAVAQGTGKMVEHMDMYKKSIITKR
ncbi:MAG: rod shape-determining protein [Patescibacteria group bacterium]